MRTIIAGSRSIGRYDLLEEAIAESGFSITTVVSGGARGVDRLGERWANKFGIPINRFIPDWARHGMKAGYLRNMKMAESADALIALWDGASSGTKYMIDIAKEKGLIVYIKMVKT